MPENAAQIGKMFVTKIHFDYKAPGETYNATTQKYDKKPGRWIVEASLSSTPSEYARESMTIEVTSEIGNKIAEIMLPLIVADASKKAQQLADDSKAMMEALGSRAILSITDMPVK